MKATQYYLDLFMRIPQTLPILVTILVLQSCTQPRYIYNQPARNLHFFNDGNQSRIAATYSTGPSRDDASEINTYNQGVDLHGAYSVSKNFALQLGYNNRKEKDVIRISSNARQYSEVLYRRKGYEFGVSYFGRIVKDGPTFFHFDAGMGFGKNSFTDVGTFDSLSLTRNYADRCTRIYLQPGLYTGTGPFQFGMGVRLQWQFFSDVQTTYRPAELVAYSLSGLSEVMNVEPYVCVRVGPEKLPWLKLELQGGFTTVNKGYYVRDGYFGMGISIDPVGAATRK